MNKKLLCAAMLLAGLGAAHSAAAQEFDDRWYVTGSVGFNIQDNDRGTNDAPFGTLGIGKFVSPNWSVDAELNYQNPNWDANQDLNWSQYGISFDARRHFIAEGRSWNPYLLMGLGYQREEIELDNFPNPDSPFQEEDGAVAGKFGVGVQGNAGRARLRAELAYRAVALDDTRAQLLNDDPPPERNDGEDWFGDVLASVGVVIPLGPEPTAPVAPAPVAPSCADMDSDGDGVNDCDDKCPGSQAGQTIGPDGCPVPVSIDLKGVNFDFDKSTLRPDAVSILNEAIEILKRYPELKVEVAGHTDSKGTDAYNQSLSERRATAVYDYLTGNGIDASRLVGPNGYGESRPIAPNTNDDGSDNPDGRARNRRTELNVQN
ncbi:MULTISPECIES: OmpA family protein [unclassified Luteimonas]|uniref:OmpA family protein n=2 Tax=Luteimonas TaxID=83614 RepID=UPI0018F06484|nr:OmpA family protein [Luteimonas sp. MC1750]MBJ6979680.1 OmpA family protein [Luteimonas sp. MC1895]QQO07301.1 OmpA family protein [Luteimonas sp. MC1750]